jgi:isoleucyl-tRNA synthetase
MHIKTETRLNWGITLPFDEDYVTYVWFDALINYISGIAYGSEENLFSQFWPQVTHLIGKDILTTHTVYWPTMLKAIGLTPPKMVFAHGWWTIEGKKMSKSAGNTIAPDEVINKLGSDVLRLWVAAEDYRDDIRISPEIMRGCPNACRFCHATVLYRPGRLKQLRFIDSEVRTLVDAPDTGRSPSHRSRRGISGASTALCGT